MAAVVVSDAVNKTKAEVSAAIAALAPTTGDFVGTIEVGDCVIFWKRTP